MKEKTEIIKSENKIQQILENEEYESKLTYQEKDGEIIYKVEMKEKTSDIDILERLEYFEPDDLVECVMYRECIEDVKTLIAENKELKEFKENIERIDKKQLDKLYKDAQKALKEYRETQNKVAKLEEENKELKEKNKELEEEDIKIRAKFILQLDNYIPKSKVKEVIEELSEELEIMKVDNMYGRYKEYGGKKKWEEMFQYKYGKHDVLQSLLGKE